MVLDDISGATPTSVTILGSTGSVGANTVDLIRRNKNRFDVEALVANRSVALLAQQAREIGAKLAVVADESCYGDLKEALAGSGIEAAAGQEAALEAAERPSDRVIAAIVGAAGLAPTLQAVRRGAIVGLANKECLVSAGSLMMAEVEKHGATLVPVDSEHSAIFQVLDFDCPETIEKIILTASGGPFRQLSREAMRNMTPEQAVAHPNWDMGAKISVDSATMMNKGLELIEAFHLFPVDESQIDILVHPQSVIHSLVAYIDGSVLAQLGTPDMRTPISLALEWPGRMATPSERLDLAKTATLNFEQPDEERFPALRLARAALKANGTAPTILNAANEIAVRGFLSGRIGFLDIAAVVEAVFNEVVIRSVETLDDVFEADHEGRQAAEQKIKNMVH